MTLALQEISDRLEIQDLVFQYSNLVDRKAFDELRDIFSEDAFIDYSETGGSAGNLEETIAFLKESLGIFPNTQHLNGNVQIVIDGDTASGRVMCFNPMVLNLGEVDHTFFLGLWYVDEYVRNAEGWRFSKRVQEASWNFNLPEVMQ